MSTRQGRAPALCCKEAELNVLSETATVLVWCEFLQASPEGIRQRLPRWERAGSRTEGPQHILSNILSVCLSLTLSSLPLQAGMRASSLHVSAPNTLEGIGWHTRNQ